MSILDIFIKPLELIFELIFSFAYKISANPAVDIFILSLAVNLLALPLYIRADKIQSSARDRENELRPMSDHIKKHFKGDEKLMILQAFYRVENYSPLSSLKSITSLLLQIPFFIAAYQFLSHLPLLAEGSIGPVNDLLKPDGLIVVFGITINVLPILMTAVNIISSEIYTRGQPFKDKIVLYLTALVFLVLLYNSPAGLVFYWLLNNVFSLVKNLIIKKVGFKEKKEETKKEKYTEIFVPCIIFLFLLLAVLIPSAVIAASPVEFVNRMIFDNPVKYIIYAAIIGAGLYIIWPSVYYALMSDKWKKRFNYIAASVVLCSVVNYLFFGPDKERLSSVLMVDSGLTISWGKIVLNIVLMIVTISAAFCLYKFIPGILKYIVVAGILAVIVMSSINAFKIVREVNDFKSNGTGAVKVNDTASGNSGSEDGIITLSQNGKNVVVIMLDRAVGGMVPYIFSEVPELYEKFDGFTYYHNTISFGDHTKIGSPALFGGYEYTPEKMNERSSELLKDKHNEAILVMPTMFVNSGFKATVIDLPLVNYSSVTDLSLFEKYEGIDPYAVEGTLNSNYQNATEQQNNTRNRNFVLYPLFRTVPVFLQELIYDRGNYNSLGILYSSKTDLDVIVSPQIPYDASNAMGILNEYMDSYTTLDGLSGLTSKSDSIDGSFVLMDNNITHRPNILQEPDYIPAATINNTQYDEAHKDRFTVDGVTMTTETYEQMSHYHINVSAYKALGKWFDYLRSIGCWDNTRIIIVSDHGFDMAQFDQLNNEELKIDFESYNALLMVKDFDSKGFKTSEEFMTNADVPSIAAAGIADPVNPFTGKPLNSNAKSDKIMILDQYSYSDELNSGNTFSPGRWFSVHDNIWDKNNWSLVRED